MSIGENQMSWMPCQLLSGQPCRLMRRLTCTHFQFTSSIIDNILNPQQHQQYDWDCLYPRLRTRHQRANVLVRLRCFAIYARRSLISRMLGLFPQLQLVPVRTDVHSVKIAQISHRDDERRPTSDIERHLCTLIRHYTID